MITESQIRVAQFNFREPEEETRIPIYAGMIPAMIAAWAILGGAGYWIYEALQ